MPKPCLYDPSFIDKVQEYLLTTGREQTSLPKRESFAKFLNVHRDTINNWEQDNPDFKQALKAIDEAQKEQLMDDGLYGGKEVNSTMAIFLLKANHNMIETSHTDITTQGEKIQGPVVYMPKEKHG